jgi:NAD/NADP transhydrogenase beta subunit
MMVISESNTHPSPALWKLVMSMTAIPMIVTAPVTVPVRKFNELHDTAAQYILHVKLDEKRFEAHKKLVIHTSCLMFGLMIVALLGYDVMPAVVSAMPFQVQEIVDFKARV